MAMPRPVDIVLESSTLAFGGGQYSPVDDTGCVVVHTKDFDFSDCEDCGFDQESNFTKSRRPVML